jgi:ABC-type amino acid transport substrate-binding protein
MKRLAVVMLLSLWAGRASAQIVCALGPAGPAPFDLRMNVPATPLALQVMQHAWLALCPTNNCGTMQLVQNPTTPNALTMTQPGGSLIAYSSAFMNTVAQRFGMEAAFGIFAHEVGHHIDLAGGNPMAWMSHAWSRELRADAWSGCALARARLSPMALQAALQAIAQFPSPSHPSWPLRLPAVQAGYAGCGGGTLPPISLPL